MTDFARGRISLLPKAEKVQVSDTTMLIRDLSLVKKMVLSIDHSQFHVVDLSFG
jgi:hypothetical protein